MNSYVPLPIETLRNFFLSVKKAIRDDPNASSDKELKEMNRLADQLYAEGRARQRALEAEARRSAVAHRRKLEADQKREDARVASRDPGDYRSRGLI